MMPLLAMFGLAAADRAPLVEAVRMADAGAVRVLLQEHTDVNVPDGYGNSALHWAVRHDDFEIARALIQAGANVEAANRYGVTPLALACTNGNAALIDQLLKAGADPNTIVTDSGETALMFAARSGQVDAIEILIAHGANVNAKETTRGQTALMWAAAEKHEPAVRALINHGADLSARSHRGLTPLMFAVRAGDIPVTSMLLDAGADLRNDRVPYRAGGPRGASQGAAGETEQGTSALVLAILNANYELAAFLLDRGADANVSDPRGSALHVLAWMRRAPPSGVASMVPRVTTGKLDALDLAEILLDRGANPNVRIDWTDPPVTPQRSDAGTGNAGEARKNDPNINPRGRVTDPVDIALGPSEGITWVGATPFYIAAFNIDVPLMRLLAAHGADARIPNRQNVTPLMAAAGLAYHKGEQTGTESESLEAVKLAYELGNDPKATAAFGDYRFGDLRLNGANALHGATLREANSVVRFLVEKGARLDVKTEAGWTPLTIAEGVWTRGRMQFHPITAPLLRQLMLDQGLSIGAEPPLESDVRRLMAEAYVRK
jgi:ankyrin repeat protein